MEVEFLGLKPVSPYSACLQNGGHRKHFQLFCSGFVFHCEICCAFKLPLVNAIFYVQHLKVRMHRFSATSFESSAFKF